MARLSTLALLAACQGPGDKSTDTASPDTGEEPEVVYEAGCILVDGEGGYARLNDAISVAEEGSIIELCEGTFSEDVLVDKGVQIVGPGTEALTWVAPTNTTAFTITADNVSLGGLTIHSVRSGVAVEGAADVELYDLLLDDIGNYGIRTVDAEGVAITAVTFEGNAYGAVAVDGGSVAVLSSTLSDNLVAGVFAEGRATVEVSGCTISGTTSEKGDSGFGVYLTGSSIGTLSTNQLTDNLVVGVYADSADVVMSGDTVQGSIYGVAVVGGSFDGSGLALTDNLYFGLYAVTGDAVTLSNSDVSGDPDTVLEYLDDGEPLDDGSGDSEWSAAGYAGVGVFAATSQAVDLSDVRVTGYNNAGLMVIGYRGDTPAVSAQGLQLDNNGRKGFYVEGDLTAIDVDVSNLREVEEPDVRCGYVDRIGGLIAVQGTVDWTGGSVVDSPGWGLSNVYGDMVVDGALVSGNACSGVIDFYGTSTLVNNTFTRSSEYAGIWAYQSEAVYVEGNVFSDSQNFEPYTLEYGDLETLGYEYSYTYHDGQATYWDISSRATSDLTISNNTFQDGDSSIQLIGGSTLVEGNTWQRYRDKVVYVYYDYSTKVDAELQLVDNTASEIGGDVLYCTYCSVDIDGLQVSDGTSYSYSYTYEYTSSDGSTTTWDYTYDSPGRAIYGNGCTIVGEDIDVQDTLGQVLYAYSYSRSGVYELSGVRARDVGQGSASYGAFYAQIYDADAEFWFEDLDLSGAGSGYGIGMSKSASYSGEGTLYLAASSIEDVETSGIYLYNASAELDGVTLSNTGTYGVDTNGDLRLSDVTVVSTGGNAIDVSRASLTMAGVLVTGAGGDAVHVDDRLDYDGDGFTVADGDCEDNDGSRFPGAVELVDLTDNDCDGTADDGLDTSDSDRDGYTIAAGDCDDTDSRTYPGASEDTWDGVDNDCDGTAEIGTEPTTQLLDVTLEDASDNGLYLTRSTGVSLSGLSSTGNGAYGMRCANTVEFDSCEPSDLAGNASGANDGCECDGAGAWE